MTTLESPLDSPIVDAAAQLEDLLVLAIEKQKIVSWLVWSLDYFNTLPPTAAKLVSDYVHEWFWSLYNDLNKMMESSFGFDTWSKFSGDVLCEGTDYCSNLELAIGGLTQLEKIPGETAWCMSNGFDDWFERFLTQARSFVAERRAACFIQRHGPEGVSGD